MMEGREKKPVHKVQMAEGKWVTAYDEQLVRKLIEKITGYGDYLEFLFGH